jgi:hypothetical protein
MSAMAVAASISYEIRKRGGEGRIAVIDTEQQSAKLYAMSRAERRRFDAMSVDDGYEYIKQLRKFPIDVDDTMTSFSPLAYVDKLQEAAKEGYDITIADSISHAWAGTGGALDRKGKAEDRGENSFTAWRTVTKDHNALVDAMLAIPTHLIVTMRMKSAHGMETDAKGKVKIVSLGEQAIQRDGIQYEFTLVAEIDQDHVATIVKTRLDGVISNGEKFDKPGDSFGRRVYSWVNDGDEPAPKVEVKSAPAEVRSTPAAYRSARSIYDDITAAASVAELQALVPEVTLAAKSNPSDANEIKARYSARKAKLIKDADKLSQLMASETDAAIAAADAKEAAVDDHGYGGKSEGTITGLVDHLTPPPDDRPEYNEESQ